MVIISGVPIFRIFTVMLPWAKILYPSFQSIVTTTTTTTATAAAAV